MRWLETSVSWHLVVLMYFVDVSGILSYYFIYLGKISRMFNLLVEGFCLVCGSKMAMGEFEFESKFSSSRLVSSTNVPWPSSLFESKYSSWFLEQSSNGNKLYVCSISQ